MIDFTEWQHDVLDRSLNKHMPLDDSGQPVENRVTVAYFTAPWCGPCRMLKPTLESLETEIEGLTVIRIDASIETELAAGFQIMSVPTLLVYSAGFQVTRIEGIKPKAVLKEEFSKWL